MSAITKSVCRLNGQNLAIGEDLARPAGLTATRWQVLSAVLQKPATGPDLASQVRSRRLWRLTAPDGRVIAAVLRAKDGISPDSASSNRPS